MATGPPGAACPVYSGRHRGSSVFLPVSSGCRFKCVLQQSGLELFFPYLSNQVEAWVFNNLRKFPWYY